MKLKLRHKLSYGIGNLGYSIVGQTITNFFMFFGTSVLKIPGSLIGIAIALSTIWDGLTDPIVGYISDNYPIKHFGYRNGYMLIATIGISFVNLLVWCVPVQFSNLTKFFWILISLLLIETFNTFFATPYTALSSDLVDDYNDRTAIQIFKTIFFILGMIVPSVLLYVFLPNTEQFPQGQLNPIGYRNIAFFTSVIMFICGVVCVFGTNKLTNKINLEKDSEKFSFKKMFSSFTECLGHKQLKLLIFGYSFAMISATILTSIGMHFFTYCFYYTSTQITILLFVLLLGMMLSQPLWYKVSLKKDKKPALISGEIIAILGIFVVMITYFTKNFFYRENFSFYIILFSMLIIGCGTGVLYSLPSSMFLDVISLLSNNQKSATYSGFLTLTSNFSNAFSLLIVGVLLDLIKFNPQNLQQNRIVQTGIAIILFVGVLFSLIMSLIIFTRYKIKQKHLKPNK